MTVFEKNRAQIVFYFSIYSLLLSPMFLETLKVVFIFNRSRNGITRGNNLPLPFAYKDILPAFFSGVYLRIERCTPKYQTYLQKHYVIKIFLTSKAATDSRPASRPPGTCSLGLRKAWPELRAKTCSRGPLGRGLRWAIFFKTQKHSISFNFSLGNETGRWVTPANNAKRRKSVKGDTVYLPQ